MIKEDKIIKIPKKEDQINPKNERRFKKEELKIDRTKIFEEPIIELSSEQFDKVDKLRKYCIDRSKCVNNCRGYISLKNFYSNDDNEIAASCAVCLENTLDGSPQAKEQVIWFNKLLQDYGMTFKDGFPRMMKYNFMGMCYECPQPHEKQMTGFIDLR